ncbi:MAG: CDGSH iron-sulfur domain-containing protein [Candidatus Methylomirabilis oxyfera]|nr:CDGSH iron-sulfur domain-containing protein [Candidatus Methylomirabilis oxyfera]
MASTKEGPQPAIECSSNGPYLVRNLQSLRNSKGESIPTKPVIALCRCGASAKKPFCDGTHSKVGFSSQRLSDGSRDKRQDYVGKGITIHDNRSICSHAGFCTERLASVFRLKTRPWIDPHGAGVDQIVEAVKRCPSGALSYSIDGVEHRDQDRDPMIAVSKDGPYLVTGGVELEDESRAEGASEEHYTLCRCGASKNKPFCDGTHWSVKFKDDKN